MNPKRWWFVTVGTGLLLATGIFGATPASKKAGPQNPQTQTEAKTKKTEAEKKAKKSAREEAALNEPAVLMDESRDPRTLNLYYGEGGEADAPDPHEVYTFLDEDLSQTQPKIDVKDAEGREWRVKMGIESKSETAATRLVWAAGYYVDEDYYLPEVRVKGLPRKLHRGEKYVDGQMIHGVRLRLQSKSKTIANWKWKHNPFVDSRDLNGLRTMMALLNNWDLVTRNNKIYSLDGKRRFLVSDLGASFGRSGNEITRKKDNIEAYERSSLIRRTRDGRVDFVMHTRPLPFMIFGFGVFKHMPRYYTEMARAQYVVQGIPKDDARWIGQRLSQLSDDQIRDCFRAAGYSPEEIDGFTSAVRQRITELAAL